MKCCRAGCGDLASWSGAEETGGCGCAGTGRSGSGLGYWSWWDEANWKRGTWNAEGGTSGQASWRGRSLLAVPRSTLRVPRSIPPAMIVVVLHEPQDLVNIAHVVRGMKNFGFRDLRLVAPREYDAHRVAGIAHQTDDVLARVRTFPSLAEALGDCVHVVGFTARGRTAKRNVQRPREAAVEITALPEGAEPIGLLFGREDKGLTNDALDRCHRIVTIPSTPSYASLNLGHAVVVMLYELAVARGADAQPFKPPRRQPDPATVEELERLFADGARALAAIDFYQTRT